jgi:hypothetical protein
LAAAFNWVALSGVPCEIGAGVGQVIVGAVGVTGVTGAIDAVGVVDAPPPQPQMGMSTQAARALGKVSLKRKKDDNSSPPAGFPVTPLSVEMKSTLADESK